MLPSLACHSLTARPQGSVSAIGIGFFAGIVYAIAKNNQKKAESASKTMPDTIIPLTVRK
jgi:GDP-mannose transporter